MNRAEHRQQGEDPERQQAQNAQLQQGENPEKRQEQNPQQRQGQNPQRQQGQPPRRRSIRTRILLTLILLTTLILLSVAVSFHLLIRGYIYRRAAVQLDAIEHSALSGRRSGDHREPGAFLHGPSLRGRKISDGFDKITGVRGSAVMLDGDGNIRELLNSEPEIAEELSAWFRDSSRAGTAVERTTLSLESGHYIVSAVCDENAEDAWLICYVDVTAIEAFTRQVNLVLFGVILAAILLSVLLSRQVARSLAEPVQRLSAFAEEIGQGDFQRREFCFREVEFHNLAESMNRMAEALQEANRKQETFFQNVSHELRTPLTSIRGCAEGIIYGVMDPKASGTVILSESDRLGGLVEDLLYLSRMGKAEPEGTAAPLDLRDVLSLCVSEQRTEAERRGVSFSFAFDEMPVLLAIRERNARELFGNLLSNAIRYAASVVRLSCHADASGVRVTIADDGPGISPEDLPHIFERFYKGAGGKHGIGLSIVKSVVDAGHGKITVQSGGEAGEGQSPEGEGQSPEGERQFPGEAGGTTDRKGTGGKGACFNIWFPV